MAEAQIQTSCGLLVDDEGRILLGLRASWKRVAPDRWDAIGGHVERGEDIEAALVREVREEVGVHATAFHRIVSLPEPRPDLYGDTLHHVFAVTSWDGTPSNVCGEHAEIRWFNAEEVAALDNTTDFDFPELMKMAVACRHEGQSPALA